MRRLSLSDTIFYNLGDCYMNAVAVLDGPCDLAVLLAEIEGVIAALPALTERSVRVGLWTFARRSSGPIDLANHVAIVRDPSVRAIADLIPRMDRLRRNPIRIDGPPWRIFVLNPAEPGGDDGAEPPLSALFMQIRHGLADAVRGLQILSRMARYEPTAAHRTLAARLPVIDPLTLEPKIAVHDAGILLLQVPRRGMVRDGDSSERLAAVVATTVADPALFAHAQPLRGNIGRTRFVRRRGDQNGVGNSLKMVTASTRAKAKTKRRLAIPGLARAQALPLSQWLVALAPRRLARMMMRIWYANFDAIATLIPMPRRMMLGGRTVKASFGIPALWGPVPLVIDVLADGDHYNATLVPGAGFTASRSRLMERLTRLLCPNRPGRSRRSTRSGRPSARRSRRSGR